MATCSPPRGQYLQEAGALQLLTTGTLDDYQAWIVRRTIIDVIEPISWPATVTVSRWCAGLSSRWADMRVRIAADNGGLVETLGFWLNINITTRSIGRMSDYVFEQLATTTDNTRLRWHPALTTPMPAEAARTFQIRRSDVDCFGHVTNAIYSQAVADAAPEVADIISHPHRVIIEFNKPIMYGEHVHLTTTPTNHGLLIWLSVNGQTRAHASITPINQPTRRTDIPGS